jgi:hypothetical protein
MTLCKISGILAVILDPARTLKMTFQESQTKESVKLP